MEPFPSNSTLHVPQNEMPLAKTSSSTSNAASAEVVQKPNVLTKRVVRKITPLDPKKLQQAGLDRKIAEALSKQKCLLNSKSPLNRISNVQTPTSPKVSSVGPSSFLVSKSDSSSFNTEGVSPAKNPIITKKVTPPKITITGPEAQTVLNTQNLEDLNPHERLVHVKNLLNKKLLQKKSTEMNDNMNNKQHLQPPSSSYVNSKNNLTARPPSPSSSYNSSQYKLPTKMPKEIKAKPKLFCNLKEPAELVKATKTEITQKSPQNIARKLQFPTDAERKVTEELVKKNNFKCLNKNFKEIPKASIKASKSQQQQQNKNIKQQSSHEREEVLPANQIYSTINESQNPKNFQAEYLKQQQIKYHSNEIPKAKIKTGQQYSPQQQQPQQQQPYGYKPLKQSEQKLDFPEVSPLKAPFPMVNVPKETPLPAIDSFKKPYNTGNTGCYDFQQNFISTTTAVWPNYEINQQPIASASSAAAAARTTSTVANSLIVLENKVLTQEEMIDLTELRLSTTTPRFINPHKPIPEVVIKEENTDEYPVTDFSTSVDSAENISQAKVTKEIQTSDKEMSTAKVVISNKQNKKIIINAQKLKLPPEQLADLARKIKQKTSNAKNAATKELNEINKMSNITVFTTKDAATTTTATTSTTSSRKTPTNLASNSVPAHNPDITAQYAKELPVKLFIQNNQIYVHVSKQDETKKSDTICNNNETLKANLLEKSHATKNFEMTESCTHLKDQINKSAVEIIDEPVDTENCFSAVDFIAALSNTNAINEETSLELSPEELNLSASCTMNPSPLNIQSYTSNKIIATTQPTQITSTTSLKSNNNNNLLGNQHVGTIVIESSTGPPTILSKDSPHKFNDDDHNKLETVQNIHNKTLNKIEIEKSSKNLFNPDCSLRKRPELKVANKPHTDCRDTKTLVAASTENFFDPKLFDNMDVKDMEIEDMEALVTTKTDTKKLDNLKIITNKKLTNANTINTNANEGKSVDPTETNRENPNKIMKNISKQTTNATTEELAKTIATKKTTSPQKSGENSQLEVKTNQIREENKIEASKISLKQSNQTDTNNSCNNFQKDLKTNADPKVITENETTNKSSLKSSCPEKIDQQKSESVTAKRISRFKKGKINLVQRNKTGQASNQSISSNDKDSAENKLTGTTKANNEENKNEINEKSNKKGNKESNKKSLIETEPEILKATNQSRKISAKNDDNIKEAAITTTNSPKEIQDLHKTNQTLSISQTTEHVITDEAKIMPLENKALPKNSESVAKTEKPLDKTLDSDVPKALLKMENRLEQDLKSTKINSTKSLNIDHKNISKGSVGMGSISQQHLITMKTNLNKSLDVDIKKMPKSSTTAEANSQDISLIKPLESDIISISKASAKISQMPQQDPKIPEKNLTESLASNTVDVSEVSDNSLQSINTNLKSLSKSSNVEIGHVPKALIEKSNSLKPHFKTTESEIMRTTSISQQFPKKEAAKGQSNEQVLNSPSSQQHSKTPEQSATTILKSEVMNTPQPSTILDNKSPQHLNSPERKRESLNPVILDISKAALNSLERSFTESVKSMDITESSLKVNSSKQQSNMPSKSLTNSFNADNMAPIKTTDSISQQLSSSTNISTQHNKRYEQKIEVSEMAVTNVTVEQEETQEKISAKSSGETQAQKTPQKLSEYKELPDNNEVTKSCKNTAAKEDQDKILKSPIQQPQDENSSKDCGMKILNKQETKAEDISIKDLSLADIVENSPIKSQESDLGTASKEVCNDTNEASGELTTPKKILLNQVESNNKEKDKLKHQQEPPIENEVEKSLEKGNEQTILAKKRSGRTGTKASKSQTETTAIDGPSDTTHSTTPLLRGDDLEFLPENAKVNLKLAKSKQNETMQPTTALTTATTTPKHKRQQRLYSKPLELELTTPTSTPCKRTRYYSQSLETNITTTFDAQTSENVKPVERTETSQDQTQEINTTKTDEVKNPTPATDNNNTDSEDENHDYDCSMKDCEESNEFLGFEEISESNSFKKLSNDAKEIECETKTKLDGGTLKNWLTTGKAISPTFDKVTNTKRIQNQSELPASTTSSSMEICDTFTKSWNLYSNLNEDTDITDDTSPLDDEEEINEQIPKKKYFKRGITNVIDSNKNLLENKKTKSDDSFEHSFIRPKTNTSSNDTDCPEKKVRKSPKSQLKRKVSEESLLKTKTAEVSPDLKGKEEKEIKCGKTIDSSQKLDESDFQQKKPSSSPRCQVNQEKCDIDSNSPDAKGSRRLKSKDKTKKESDTSKSTTKHSTNPDTALSCDDKLETEKLNTVPILETQNLAKMKEKHKMDVKDSTTKDSNRGRRKATKKLEAQNVKEEKNKDLDISVKIHSLDSVDIPQTVKASKNSNNKNSTNQEQSENPENPKTVIHEKENSITQTEKAEVENRCCPTPQNSTIKRKRGRPSKTPIQTSLTLSDQRSKMETQQKDLKRSIISETADDDSPLPSAKKRRLQTSSTKRNKNENSDSEFISLTSNETQEMASVVDNLEPIATPTVGLVKQETPLKSTVGRKRSEANFNPRLLLITKREQLDTDEVLTEAEPGTGAIQCGLCLERTEPAKWTTHLAKHYGVGWQVGEEQLNLEIRTVVLNCIMNYMKYTKCKGLCCRMCKKIYRSALGLVMHIESCGAEAIRLQCEFCNRDFAKSSLAIHMRTCSAKKDLEDSSSDENVDEDNNEKKEEIFGNTGRLKRHSTIKAESKLKILGAELEKMSDNVVTAEKPEFDPKTRIRYVPPLKGDFTAKWSEDIEKLGKASCPKTRCKFTSTDLKELNEHLKTCKHIKSGYFCNYCLQRMFKSEKEAIAHVLKMHQHGRGRKKSDDSDVSIKIDTEESSDDNDLSEGANESEIENENVTDQEDDLDDNRDNKKASKRQKAKKPCNRNINKTTIQTTRKPVFDARCIDVNKKVLRKWKNFLKLNHSSQPLYTEFKTQYSVVNNQDYDKYLPTQTVSMKFNLTTKQTFNRTIGEHKEDVEWSELKRFESLQNEMSTFLFLGAPIKLCSWLPLPAHVNEQYLAVVYRQEMFKFIKFSQPKQHHTIILIFKVIQNNKIPELNVHYGFLIHDGPVHHLSFLPSGGYDESANRLGLVAIATVTSTIKVYSLPLNVDLGTPQENCGGDESITLIEAKPSFLLNIDVLNNKEEQQQRQHVLLNPQCMQICWSEYRDHQHIFASFSNGFLGIWDITNDPHQNLNRFEVENVLNYVPLNYFYVGEKCVKCFAVHYDTCGPRWLAASGAYRKLIIYDIKNFSQPIIMKEDISKNILTSMDWCPLWETLLCSYCDAIFNNGRCVLVINPSNVMFSHVKLDFMACGVAQVHYTPVTNMCVAAMNNGDIAFLDTKELHYDCALSKQFHGRRMLCSLDVKQLNGQPIVKLPKANQKN